ncbi:MAG: FISUMP domain-containing protein [Bacteroidota bacterium]
MKAASTLRTGQPATLCAVLLCISAVGLARGPESTRPVHAGAGWNLLSVPASVANGSRAFLFPSAVSSAYVFQYPAGYVPQDTLHNGTGFWLKFNTADTVFIEGESVFEDTVEVHAGWNIIGSLSVLIAVDSIKTEPPGIIGSEFFLFRPGVGYEEADTLYPGYGYWVKVNQAGSMVLSSGSGLPCPGTPTVSWGGKTYNTVLIGTQCWFRENLDIGTMVPGAQNQTDNGTIEKYCYSDNPVNCDTYGGLYQWIEAMQYDTTEGARGICPPGWHVPTLAEFQTLSATVGGDGNALKAIGQGTGGGAGTNTSGFSALLAGHRYGDGGFGSLGYFGLFWSSTQYDATYARNLFLSYGGAYILLGNYLKAYGFSVRCLQGEAPNQPPDAPSNPSPPDGSLGQSPAVMLGWTCSDPDSDALTYDVYFGSSNPPDTLVSSNQPDTILARTGLVSGATYYWKVVAKDDRGDSTAGPAWSFTTNLPPGAPANPYPDSGATHITTSPTLSWSCSDPDSDPLTYDVYFDMVHPPDTLVSSNQPDTILARTGLVSGATYYWKVVAKDDHGDSTAGPAWSFTTNSPPVVPFNPTPADSATGQALSPTLRWSCNDPEGDSVTYRVYFDTVNPPLAVLSSAQSDTTFGLDTLSGGISCFWKVTATDSHGDSTPGPVWSFTTTNMGFPCPGIPTVDYAGKIYNTVQIGSQCWLKENLDVGTRIDSAANPTNNGTVEKYCYSSNPANCVTYGGLYQWDEAMQYDATQGTQGICPPGWHVPTLAEIQALSSAVGGNGNALKAIGQGTGGGAGTNTSGFSALLAGYRRYNGLFQFLGDIGYFWSSTQYDATSASILRLSGYDASINLLYYIKPSGFPVRCLED